MKRFAAIAAVSLAGANVLFAQGQSKSAPIRNLSAQASARQASDSWREACWKAQNQKLSAAELLGTIETVMKIPSHGPCWFARATAPQQIQFIRSCLFKQFQVLLKNKDTGTKESLKSAGMMLAQGIHDHFHAPQNYLRWTNQADWNFKAALAGMPEYKNMTDRLYAKGSETLHLKELGKIAELYFLTHHMENADLLIHAQDSNNLNMGETDKYENLFILSFHPDLIKTNPATSSSQIFESKNHIWDEALATGSHELRHASQAYLDSAQTDPDTPKTSIFRSPEFGLMAKLYDGKSYKIWAKILNLWPLEDKVGFKFYKLIPHEKDAFEHEIMARDLKDDSLVIHMAKRSPPTSRYKNPQKSGRANPPHPHGP